MNNIDVIVGREYIVVRDGIYAETVDELLDKLEWCDSVGLNQNPMRLQPVTVLNMQLFACYQ